MNENNNMNATTNTTINATTINAASKAKKARRTSKTLVELGPLAKVYGAAASAAYYAREAQINDMAQDASLWTPREIANFRAKNWRLLLKGSTMPKFALDCYWNMIPVPETFSQSVATRLAS